MSKSDQQPEKSIEYNSETDAGDPFIYGGNIVLGIAALNGIVEVIGEPSETYNYPLAISLSLGLVTLGRYINERSRQ